MLDSVLIHGFNEPELVHAQPVFSHLESLKMPKKTPGGSFFIQFSLLRPKKYKTNQKRTLLTSEEETCEPFSYLVREVQKRLNYHLPNSPLRTA